MYNYLICNTQDVFNSNGQFLGKRVCDIATNTFEVSKDYEWKQYAEYCDVYSNIWYWSNKPTAFIVQPTAEQNKLQATKLLQETDWTTVADVADPALSNPYLMNQSAFFAYRSSLRQIAVNPVEGVIAFPVKPVEQWSQ